jgi:hypothetical protein
MSCQSQSLQFTVRTRLREVHSTASAVSRREVGKSPRRAVAVGRAANPCPVAGPRCEDRCDRWPASSVSWPDAPRLLARSWNGDGSLPTDSPHNLQRLPSGRLTASSSPTWRETSRDARRLESALADAGKNGRSRVFARLSVARSHQAAGLPATVLVDRSDVTNSRTVAPSGRPRAEAVFSG